MSYGKLIRNHDRGLGRGKSGGKGGGSSFKRDWKPGEVAELVRFFKGYYGRCEDCGGHVDCDEEGKYRCENSIFGVDADGEVINPLDKDAEIVGATNKRCGHEGELTRTAPVAINHRAFIPGGGKRRKGAMVVGNSWDGRLNKPDLVVQHQADTDAPARSAYAHNLVRLSLFHLVEFTNEGKDKTWKQKELCEGKRRCKYCKSKDAEESELHFGKKEFYNPGFGIFKQLCEWDRVIGTKCKNCEEGQIMSMLFMCNGEGCGHMYIDMDECSLTDKQLAEFATSVQECPECGTEDEPLEVVQCFTGDEHDPDPGCDEGERASLWDVNIKIKRGDKSVQIVGDPELCEPDERIAELTKPMKMQFLAEMPLSLQAMLMNKDNVYDEDGGAGGGDPGKARRAKSTNYDK